MSEGGRIVNLLKVIWDETFGMFVDDGALALQVVVLIGVLAGAVKLAGLPPLWAAPLLIMGLLGILALSLRRKVRGA